MHLSCLGIVALSFSLFYPALAQVQPVCPARSGVYALKDEGWVEVPTARADKEKLRTGLPFHGITIAVYIGATASMLLKGNISICASGIQPGTTFYLARAKQKKASREVKTGTYSALGGNINFNIDSKQAIAINQTRDANGNYIIHANKLNPGQYLLFMAQGSSLSTTPPAFDFFTH